VSFFYIVSMSEFLLQHSGCTRFMYVLCRREKHKFLVLKLFWKLVTFSFQSACTANLPVKMPTYVCTPNRGAVMGGPQHGKFALSCWDSRRPSRLKECPTNVSTAFHHALEDPVRFVSIPARGSGDIPFNISSWYVTHLIFIIMGWLFPAHFQDVYSSLADDYYCRILCGKFLHMLWYPHHGICRYGRYINENICFICAQREHRNQWQLSANTNCACTVPVPRLL
jgi:hypothetical protein